MKRATANAFVCIAWQDAKMAKNGVIRPPYFYFCKYPISYAWNSFIA